MCFGGGGGSPQAPVSTPAVPVSDITAGNPTVTVQPNSPAPAPDKASPVQATSATQNNQNVGLSSSGLTM